MALAEPDSLQLLLDVELCRAVSAEVAALVVRRGWQLVELQHDLPTLESVFLQRTRGLERPIRRVLNAAQEGGSQ